MTHRLIPTCMQTKQFEGLGFSRQQSEQLTSNITERIILDRMLLSEKFVPKSDLEKVGLSTSGSMSCACTPPQC